MYISEALRYKWASTQISRSGRDAGTVVLEGSKGKAKKEFIELGWFLLKRTGEGPKIIRNNKHPVSTSFVVERDPESKSSLGLYDWLEDLGWKETVLKTIPKEILDDY